MTVYFKFKRNPVELFEVDVMGATVKDGRLVLEFSSARRIESFLQGLLRETAMLFVQASDEAEELTVELSLLTHVTFHD